MFHPNIRKKFFYSENNRSLEWPSTRLWWSPHHWRFSNCWTGCWIMSSKLSFLQKVWPDHLLRSFPTLSVPYYAMSFYSKINILMVDEDCLLGWKEVCFPKKSKLAGDSRILDECLNCKIIVQNMLCFLPFSAVLPFTTELLLSKWLPAWNFMLGPPQTHSSVAYIRKSASNFYKTVKTQKCCFFLIVCKKTRFPLQSVNIDSALLHLTVPNTSEYNSILFLGQDLHFLSAEYHWQCGMMPPCYPTNSSFKDKY